MLTYGFNVWIEATVIPFLAVMTVFLYFRYRTTEEVNVQFRRLTLSTFLVTLLEVSSTLLIDGWGHRHFVNLTIRSLYYIAANINAYQLMRYVQAHVKIKDKKFDAFNHALIFSSFVVILLNLLPMSSGFFFRVASDGGLYRGPYNTLWRSVYALYFVSIAGYLQLANKEAYPSKYQYQIMNLLGLILILSFVIQYMFIREVLFTYTIACVVLFIIFFYYEAPTYRRMLTVEKKLKDSRIATEKSTQMAQAANRAKSDFLANTTHEIRTPMNAILGMNEIILKECDDETIRKAALDIRKAGNHLLAMINNILDISKIESGKMELYKADYHLGELLKEIENSTIKAAHERKLKFILEVNKDIQEHLYGDEDKLKLIITNLIDNALKYTKKGKIILRVDAEELENEEILKIEVEDTGIGIRKNDIDKLFKSFERVNLIETQNIQGAGLGLTLVRYILQLMRGEITVESEYGKGSKFTVKLPQRFSKNGLKETIKEYENSTANQDYIEETEDEEFICPDAKILVVDDTPVNLVVAKAMLKEYQAKIDTAESGEECLEKLKQRHYDIVFLDHKMPVMDGVETLKEAKKIDEKTIYIALTAHTGRELREEYINFGFNDYLSKPMKIELLKGILRKYLPKERKIRYCSMTTEQ